MAFSKIEKLNTEELEKTVLETSQQLVELRLKKQKRKIDTINFTINITPLLKR